MSAFSTTRANEAFETTFTRPVKAMLQREIADSSRAYAEIGALWLQADLVSARLGCRRLIGMSRWGTQRSRPKCRMPWLTGSPHSSTS